MLTLNRRQRQGLGSSLIDVVLTEQDGHAKQPDPFTFPAFHAEILQQPRWEPGEQSGRIQVAISEGVFRPAGGSESHTQGLSFDGLRDVIVFSFQHAPQGMNDLLKISLFVN
jgi:hypothetical protein